MKFHGMVLIVDDDEDMRLLIRKKLTDQGNTAVTAATGGEALAWLEGNVTDLILLDLSLPDITGQELLAMLGKRKKSIPFIVISGMNDVRLTVEMMRLGALDFILKDSKFLDLVAPIVERGLDTIDSRRRLEESQARLDYISKTIKDVFWMMDACGERVVFVSPAFEAIWGFPADRLYGHSDGWNESIIEQDRSKVLRSFEKLRLGSERDFDEVYRIRDKLGKIRWIRDRGYANLDAGGDILNFTGVATEVTEYKALEREVLAIAENERMRIGQELHDDLCQRLAAIGLKCGIVQGVLQDEAHEQAEPLGTAISELQEAAALTRTIARGLSPVTLEAEGLMAGLKHLTEMISERFLISCQFDCPEPVEVSDATTASNIFRIAQELVNNAANHAHPRRILVGLYKAMGGLRMEITNDGKPFYGPQRCRHGMGLHFVQFRADAIGAALDFFPGDPPDGGTRVICIVPLGEKVEEIQP